MRTAPVHHEGGPRLGAVGSCSRISLQRRLHSYTAFCAEVPTALLAARVGCWLRRALKQQAFFLLPLGACAHAAAMLNTKQVIATHSSRRAAFDGCSDAHPLAGLPSAPEAAGDASCGSERARACCLCYSLLFYLHFFSFSLSLLLSFSYIHFSYIQWCWYSYST